MSNASFTYSILIDASFCLRFWFKSCRIYPQKSREWQEAGEAFSTEPSVFVPETMSASIWCHLAHLTLSSPKPTWSDPSQGFLSISSS